MSILVKFILSCVSLLMFIGFIYFFYIDQNARAAIMEICMLHPNSAPVILLITQVTLATFFIPCSFLTVVAGMLWGARYGVIYSTIASLFSAIWTFWLARIVLTSLKSSKFICKITRDPKLKNISIYSVMIAYVNPVLPGSSLGYLFGFTNIRFHKFVLGAIIGTLPLQFVMTYLGASTDDFYETTNYLLLLIIIVFIIILINYRRIFNYLITLLGKYFPVDQIST